VNFLAHFHLSETDPESLLGNFLGDFVTGDPSDRYSEQVCAGIHMHRRIDAFTDSHPDWKASKGRLSKERRRFAGVIVDIFYDYFLCRHWMEMGNTTGLDESVASYYASLREVEDSVVEPHAQRALSFMIEENWLGRYATLRGIDRSLDRVSLRSPRIGAIAGAAEELTLHEAEFDADFIRFYPKLQAFVQSGGISD